MDNRKNNNDSFVSAKLFISALIIIAILMVCSYVATLVIDCKGIELWRWLASPILLLGADGSVSIIGVIVFLLIIGGVFNALEKAGILEYIINKIAAKYSDKKYTLMAVVMFFFMALGSLIGSFEEVVPLVPIVVALALRFGWDRITGVAMSLLAVGCGFAAGVFNPFTVGIAQEIAGLPMFSGALFRAFNFVCIYCLLYFFTKYHAKKICKEADASVVTGTFESDSKKDKAGICFAVIVGIGILIVMSSAFIKALTDYTFIIVGVMFLIAGIVSCRVSGMSGKELGKWFIKGLISMLPAVVMILMASSIKYTLEYAGALEVVVNAAINVAKGLPKWSIILFMYLIALVMNFFIPSGSAKAVMLMPLLLPLAQEFGVSAQLVIVAYAFGDGFSNVFYPTNPALLVALGLADTDYVSWAKWSWKFQGLNLILTSVLLLIGQAIGV